MNPAVGMRPGSRPRNLRLVTSLAAGLLAAVASSAAAPTLEHLFPFTFSPGSTQNVTLAGKIEPWPPSLWVQGPGITWSPETNAGKARLEIATHATPGPRWVRLYNEDGVSDPRFILITPSADVQEVEPNQRPSTAQRLGTPPVRVVGRLEKSGDVDSFALTIPAGHWLDARLEAYVLMAKLDGVLRLLDASGQPLAWNHDGDTLDPHLRWHATQDTNVVLQVFGFRYPADSSVQLSGGDGAVYRLLLDALEQAPQAIPPDSPPSDVADRSAETPAPGITPERWITGTIARIGEEDRHLFRAEAGDFVEARIDAASLGSPLDATLRILDPAGAELAQADDAEGSRDPRLVWRVPTNGVYFAAVRSLLRRQDPEYRYRLTLRRLNAEARVTLITGSVTAAPGTTNEVKFRVARQAGHTNALQIRFKDLPPGFTAHPVPAPAGDGEGSLTLVSATNAAAFSGPLIVVAEDPVLGNETLVPFEMTSRGENNGVPQGYSRLWINQIDHLWLTLRLPKEK
ncbi:MAG: PPC domain-containing protein [Verrucomicrobiales bacterium]|nr:PPC domain-containing protein [Verrucomicrobiales bacterium]